MPICLNPPCLNPAKVKFCSRSCSAKVTNSTHPRRKKKTPSCGSCGAPCEYGRKFCSDACRPRRVTRKPSPYDPNLSDEERTEARRAYNVYMKEYMLRRYYRRQAEWRERLGGVCVRCGTTEDLEFDHIDRTTKSFTIGSRLGSSSEAVIAAEMAKCQLLCTRCHIKKGQECGDLAHGGGTNRIEDPIHGTCTMYQREGCRCDTCRTWRRLSNKKLVHANGQLRDGVTAADIARGLTYQRVPKRG